ALAAVGASGPLFNLMLVLFMGISTGTGIAVSQYFGAKQKGLLSKAVGNAISLTIISSIFIMVVGTIITPRVLRILNTPEEILQMARQYLTIIFLGIAGMSFYNIMSGILRGLGDSVSPLMFLLVACVLNIVLDIYFVASLNLGVPGVAYATVISQVVSAIACMIKAYRMKDVLTLNMKSLVIDPRVTGKILRFGLPSGLTQGIFSMAMIVVQSLTNSLGTVVIATNVVVMRVDGFAMMPNFTFGIAMTTYAGQNVGAGYFDRVKKGTKDGLLLAVSVSAFMTLCILLFGVNLMHLFTQTERVVELGVHAMRILAVGYIAMAVTQVLSGTMRGAGDTMTPMWISIVTTILIRVPLAYTLAFFTRSEEWPNGSPYALFVSLLTAWSMGAIITSLFFKKGKWRKLAEKSYKDAGNFVPNE
ncbi:MAG: MATE family efflux transporter, partial [Clostridiales bacterium]|nr:MATE family efflux transporter [Clostridiales bacterium]